MAQTPKKHPARNVAALVLLAIFCVGAVELAVARFTAPGFYESVTAPVRTVCRGVSEWFSGVVSQSRASHELRRQEDLERRQRAELDRQREQARHEFMRQRELAAAELAVQLATRPAIEEALSRADPGTTALVFEDGLEKLTGGNFSLVYFNQGDEIWKNEPFGSDPIGGYGCGPTSLAMLAATLADKDATPASVAAWAARAGYCAPRSGSYLSIVQGVCEHFGLPCVSLGAVDADTLLSHLYGGGAVVALMGPGHFTARGHFILLHGVTDEGGVLVADPNSRENSLAVWDAQTIVDELSKSRHDGAPLWLVSPPV